MRSKKMKDQRGEKKGVKQVREEERKKHRILSMQMKKGKEEINSKRSKRKTEERR